METCHVPAIERPADESGCREYTLSAASPAALFAVAQLAPTLKEAALRVLLHLTARAVATRTLSVAASSRELADAARVARSSVVLAIDELAGRGIIATRAGTPTKPAAYLLRFLEVVRMPDHPPVENGLEVVRFPDQGGPIPGPPPYQFSMVCADAPIFPVENSRVDSEGVLLLEGILDRVSRAKAKDFDRETLAAARSALHGHRLKLPLPDERGNPPHPPDDLITAQFLAMGHGAGGWPRLQDLLLELRQERKQAFNYAWFVSVAAQRIHGIDPRALKRRREELRLVRDRAREAREAGQRELVDVAVRVEQLAFAKAMR